MAMEVTANQQRASALPELDEELSWDDELDDELAAAAQRWSQGGVPDQTSLPTVARLPSPQRLPAPQGSSCNAQFLLDVSERPPLSRSSAVVTFGSGPMGMGMEMGPDKLVVVTDVAPSGAAARLGVRSGWGLLELNEQPCDGLSKDDVIRRLVTIKGDRVLRFALPPTETEPSESTTVQSGDRLPDARRLPAPCESITNVRSSGKLPEARRLPAPSASMTNVRLGDRLPDARRLPAPSEDTHVL